MDLSKMSLTELRELDARLTDELSRGASKRRAAAMEQILAIAREVGVPLPTLLKDGAKQSVKPRRKTKRYQDPSNPANTWAGAGPRPAWFKKALAAGVPIGSLEA
jgi:DNA-binding protein H-NS